MNWLLLRGQVPTLSNVSSYSRKRCWLAVCQPGFMRYLGTQQSWSPLSHIPTYLGRYLQLPTVYRRRTGPGDPQCRRYRLRPDVNRDLLTPSGIDVLASLRLNRDLYSALDPV